MDCDHSAQNESSTCWRCGTETPFWLRVYPVPRSSNILWCLHCYVEVHANFDKSNSEQLVMVEVDMEILLYIASAEPPKVESGFGSRHVPRLLHSGWILEGDEEPVPEREMQRLRHWWPQFMAWCEADLGS